MSWRHGAHMVYMVAGIAWLRVSGWVSTAPAPFPVPTKVNTATGSLSSERCVCVVASINCSNAHTFAPESVWQNESTVVPCILRFYSASRSQNGEQIRDGTS